MTDFQFIDLSENGSLTKRLANVADIGLDTEFIREKTFFSWLCLVQVSIDKDIYCADPLDLPSVDPEVGDEFWRNLAKTNWVLHSGRQDIEVLYQTSGYMPDKVFDTQIAASLLGFQPQIGYAGLVAELFDVQLEKSHTRADWSRRPLPESFMNYAAEDVLYLLPARDALTERLAALGRAGWAEEDSADLLNPSLYETDPKLAVDRLKGAGRLRGAQRAAANELAIWREQEALRNNRPRQWILRDSVLLEMAVSQPVSESALEDINGLGKRTINRAGKQLIHLIANASNAHDDFQPPKRPDEKQKQLLKEMQSRVVACAQKVGIANEILVPRKELSAAMFGETDGRVFKGWRKTVIGDELLGLL